MISSSIPHPFITNGNSKRGAFGVPVRTVKRYRRSQGIENGNLYLILDATSKRESLIVGTTSSIGTSIISGNSIGIEGSIGILGSTGLEGSFAGLFTGLSITSSHPLSITSCHASSYVSGISIVGSYTPLIISSITLSYTSSAVRA